MNCKFAMQIYIMPIEKLAWMLSIWQHNTMIERYLKGGHSKEMIRYHVINIPPGAQAYNYLR
jgi:hypothetical protein